MGRSRRTRLTFLALCFLIGCSTAFAQNGTIHGVVLDPQAAAVSGARVTAFDEAKGQVIRETVTSADGAFQLLPLPRGTYTVKIEMSGFKTTERTQLTLDPNQIMNLGVITLELGQTAESVTIQAEVPLVETTTANKSFVLSSRQVTELSINGRDFQNLMLTLPGVVSNNASSFRLAFNSTDQFNVNGMRGSANNFFLDGSINTDVGANDGQYTQLSMDAVGEFKVQTSVFSAELGRNPGILLSATTKSGGQEFHGTVYEFLRNNALDARLPLDRTGRVADLRFNQFGGNIGGPVILPKISPSNNKKVFFFFNYEGTRASRPRGSNFRDLPHPDLLTGDLSRLLRPQRMQFAPNFNVGTVFQPGTITRDSAGRVTGGLPFPNNLVPRSMWSRNAEAFLRVIGSFPTAGGVVLPSSPELIRVPYQEIYRFYKNQYVARIDYSISPKANFFFRWVRDDQNEEQPTGIFTSAPFPVFPQFREKPGRSFSWNLINVISPSMTNEAIVTYNDLDQLVDVTPGTDPSMYDKDALGFRIQELYPQVNVRNRFPRFSCGVGDCNFSNFPANWRSEGTTYAFTDNFTVIRGSHTFKFGTFLNRNDNAQQPSWTDALNVSFSPSFINPNDTDQTFANMLLGNYTSINQSDGIYYGRFRFFGMEFYGQDSWKVNRRLTLELGARYVYLGPTYTLGKFLMYYFDPARYDPAQAVQIETARGATQGSIIPGSGDPFNGMVQEGSPGVPKGFSKHRWNQVSPRFGIAIDPFGDGKTSIRAGGGIFWERIRQNNLNFDGLGNPPLAFNPSIFAGNIDDVSPALLAGGVRFPQGIRAWSAEGKNPTIYSWSVNIQRQLPGQTSVDIGYIGNLGRHLMDVRDINQLPLGTTINTPILSNANGVANAVRPYRGYTSILFTDFDSNSNYNALQVRVSRRFSANLTFNMNYTWSKALGYTETDTEDIGYFLDRRRNYGPLDYDRTHVFNMDYVYLLPKFGTRIGHPAARLILDGWQISGITRFSSGRPLTVTLGGNPGTLGGGVRADYLGGDIFEGTDQISTANPMYFNPFRFARPPEGTLGNTANGIFRGPGINNWDMSLFKNTRISERVTAQLRFEFFNVFNHTQWDGINTSGTLPNPGPVTEATRGQLGEITSSRDPRNIQLGLKIYF